VVNRAEVPFDYPVAASLGRGKRKLLAHAAHPIETASAEARSVPPVASSAGPAGAPPSASLDGRSADASSPQPSGLADDKSQAAVVRELQTAKVIRGDSLWRISRKMLGHGVQYTEIYASNATQIRDPSLIYPGQIFVVPNHAVE
jgi:nucleoid-associated protein YgaU